MIFFNFSESSFTPGQMIFYITSFIEDQLPHKNRKNSSVKVLKNGEFKLIFHEGTYYGIIPDWKRSSGTSSVRAKIQRASM